MASTTKPLTDKEIKAAKPQSKTYKLFDGGGLFLSVPPSGQKRWRLKYRFNGKEKLLSLGVYPQISLQDARRMREEFKSQIAKGFDPSEIRKQEKEDQAKEEIRQRHTFQAIALEWLEKQETELAESTHYR